MIAVAMYGTEAAPIDQQSLRGLQSAIVDAMVPNSTLHSHDSAFTLNSFGPDLDLDAIQFAETICYLA